MADEREQHGIGIEIDSSGAAAGEARVVRSLEHIKRKTKETGDAGAKAGGEAAAGFSRMGRAGEQAGRTMDSIRNKARHAGDAAAAAAGRAGSAWGAAFRRFQQMGAGGLGNVFAAMGRDADKLTGSTNNASGAFLRARLSANGLYTSLIALRNAAVVLVGVQLARKFLEVTDSMKRMQAQLRLTIPASMSMATAQKEVLGIAARTRTALEPITELYGRVARQVTEMGHGSEAAARATETVAKALKVSGASAIEQASVIRQLTQALASGVLRGDEFNAIMENSPRLAKLFADSIGVPVGALRKMAEEGEITAARLMKAMTDPEFTKKLDTEFRQLPITWEEAWIQIKNTAAVVLNAFDQGGQFSNALVNFAMSGSENIDDLSAKFEELGVDLRAIFAGLSGLFDPLSVESEGFFGFVRDQIKGLERAVEDVLAAWDAAAAGARNAVVGAAWTVPGLGPFLGPMANAMAPPATSTLDAYRASRDQSRAYGTRSMQERRFYSNLPRGLDWRTPGAIEMWSSGEFNKKPPAMPTEANDNASKSRTNAQALADFIHELNKQGLQTLTNPIRTAASPRSGCRWPRRSPSHRASCSSR